MFLGEYEHSLDAKGRVILPARFRDQLTEGGFVTKGRGGCLSVFTPEEFEDVASQVRELSKRGSKDLNAARSFFSGAADDQPRQAGAGGDPAEPARLRGADPRSRGRRACSHGSRSGTGTAGTSTTGSATWPSRTPTTCRSSASSCTLTTAGPMGPPPAPRAARRKRPFRPLRFRRCVRGAGGGLAGRHRPKKVRPTKPDRRRRGSCGGAVPAPAGHGRGGGRAGRAGPDGLVRRRHRRRRRPRGGDPHRARPDLRLLGIDRDPARGGGGGGDARAIRDEGAASCRGSSTRSPRSWRAAQRMRHPAEGNEEIVGILFDLGVSSPQLDRPVRGFSYWADDAPLDMRMDSAQELTAGDRGERATPRPTSPRSSRATAKSASRAASPPRSSPPPAAHDRGPRRRGQARHPRAGAPSWWPPGAADVPGDPHGGQPRAPEPRGRPRRVGAPARPAGPRCSCSPTTRSRTAW